MYLFSPRILDIRYMKYNFIVYRLQGAKDNIPIIGVCLENFTMPIKILDSICITIRVLSIEQVDVIEGYSRETPEQLYYLRMEKSMLFQCLEDMTNLMTLDLKGVNMKNKKVHL